jgi:hypothetical protein
MITGAQIEQLKKYPGICHISALRGESIHKFIEDGLIERSLFDEKHIETTIANGQFLFQRNAKSIQYESEIDGFYVIRIP